MLKWCILSISIKNDMSNAKQKETKWDEKQKSSSACIWPSKPAAPFPGYQSEGQVFTCSDVENPKWMVNELVALFLTGCISSIIVVFFVGFTIPNYSRDDTHIKPCNAMKDFFIIQLHIPPYRVTQNEQKGRIESKIQKSFICLWTKRTHLTSSSLWWMPP